MTDPEQLLLHSDNENKSGSLIAVDPATAGWVYTSLDVVRLPAGSMRAGNSGRNELGLVVLGGRCQVAAAGETWQLGERTSVFTGQPWALYLPIESHYVITAETPLEIAICGARAEESHPPRLISPDQVEVEIRGAGNAARQINHIVKPDFPAHRLLIVEVFTPNGNWSSIPPHKHDVSNMPAEADLEEIYYYRIDPPNGFGLQRLYTADGRIDQAYVIHDGDLLLVPEGYHVFAVAHGSTGYYLNVLAGNESVRTMQPSDDPAYAWLRNSWQDEQNGGARSWQEIDQRINLGAGRQPS